jgi:glyoxylase-like metal-dependent hydrolase (beta-lactamase superfamily II)
MRITVLLLATAALAACRPAATGNDAAAGAKDPPAAADAVPLSLTRLDCGKIRIKNFNKFFSDKPGLYESASRDIVASCYVIRHGDQVLLWDTGLSGALKGGSKDMGEMVASLDTTIVEQLDKLGIKPADVDVVGISHHHDDHTGQLDQFSQARLIIGAGDFVKAQAKPPQGGEPTITPWLKAGANVTKATADVDVFGDGRVVAMHLPGHTPDHLALLVNLASGPVLVSGDLYHSLDAREKRGVPPFNTSREQTLASMDRFEAKAKAIGAKVIIQHEPRDIAKLPAFPDAAR